MTEENLGGVNPVEYLILPRVCMRMSSVFRKNPPRKDRSLEHLRDLHDRVERHENRFHEKLKARWAAVKAEAWSRGLTLIQVDAVATGYDSPPRVLRFTFDLSAPSPTPYYKSRNRGSQELPLGVMTEEAYEIVQLLHCREEWNARAAYIWKLVWRRGEQEEV